MNKTVENLCENFNKDMDEYLKAAFPDADTCKIKEAAAYATSRMSVNIFDIILKRDDEWKELYNELLKTSLKTSELLRREVYNDK